MLRACAPPADAEYLAALGRVAAWRVEHGDLALLDADAAELLRYRAPSPVGSWKATAFLQGSAVASPLRGTEVTALFDERGTLSGSAGCNAYRATYRTDGA
jgi:heat shock protein HslJ